MKPRIIVSVPGPSATATDPAVARALALARWSGAVLHVVRVRASGDERHGPALEHGALLGDGVEVVPVVLSGRPVCAIADHVSRVSADLVVMGRTVRQSSGYWSAEAFASAVARAVKVPTIIVPDDPVRPPAPVFRDVLVAVDFSEASLRAAAEALRLAQQSGAHLRLLHALDGSPCESACSGSRATRSPGDLRERAARADRALVSLVPSAAGEASRVEINTVAGEAADAILSAAAARPTDLIVLGVPRRSRFDQAMAGSTAQRVLRRAKAPVLLVPGPRAPRLPSPSEVQDAIRSGWTLDRPLSTPGPLTR